MVQLKTGKGGDHVYQSGNAYIGIVQPIILNGRGGKK
jgi:hypothetical protein